MQSPLSEFLKALRDKHHQEKRYTMAKRLGVSTSYLSTVENGKRPMSDRLYQTLVDVYQLSPDEVKTLKKFKAELAAKMAQSKSADPENNHTVTKFL